MPRLLGRLALVLGALGPSQEKTRAPATTSAPSTRPASRPFLWRVEGKPAAWLFGTIHVADPRVTTLPAVVSRAFEQSDVIVTEVELGGDTAARAARFMALPGKQQLKDVLPPATWTRFSGWLERHGLPANALARFKVWVATVVLVTRGADLRDRGIQALDRQLVDRAKEADKETDALETIQEQLGLFDRLSADEQTTMLDGTLDLVERAEKEGTSLMEMMVSRYLTGDADTLLEDARKFSGLHRDKDLERRCLEAMLDDRNVVMVDRMLAKMKARPDKVHFIAVGVAHMGGPRGILALLAGKGIKVTRVLP